MFAKKNKKRYTKTPNERFIFQLEWIKYCSCCCCCNEFISETGRMWLFWVRAPSCPPNRFFTVQITVQYRCLETVLRMHARWLVKTRVFTITAEIHARSLVNFCGQYADRHMNLKFVRRVSEREGKIRQFFIVKNKLISIFNAPVLLLTMNFVITLPKESADPLGYRRKNWRRIKNWRQFVNCITRGRHRASARSWRSDGASKVNLHFDNLS